MTFLVQKVTPPNEHIFQFGSICIDFDGDSMRSVEFGVEMAPNGEVRVLVVDLYIFRCRIRRGGSWTSVIVFF